MSTLKISSVRMSDAREDSIFNQLGLTHRRPPELFRSAAEVNHAKVNGYTHTVRRAWKSFDDLCGVLSVRGRPTVYFQQQSHDGRISLTNQRRFWSNGVAPILVRVAPSEVRVYSGLRPPALISEDVDADKRLIDVFDRTAKALEARVSEGGRGWNGL